MHVRKIKYFLLFAIILLCLFCFIIPVSLLSYGKKVQEKNTDKARNAYISLLAFNPFSLGKDDALYRLASIILPDEVQKNKYTIYNTGMSRNGQYINYEMVDKAEEYLKQIIARGEHGAYYADAYKKLFHLNIMCGRLGSANELIQNGIKSENPKIRDMSFKFNMLLSFAEKDYNKVLYIGNKLMGEKIADYDTYILMGDACYLDNKLTQAEEYYNTAKNLSQNGLIKSNERWVFETDNDAFSSLRLIEKAKKLFTGNGQIKGKVEVNDKAVPFAYVYLKNSIDDEFNTTGMERETIYTLTDSKGNYEFNNLPDRTYSLGIGINSIYLTDSVYQSPRESYIFLKNNESVNYDFKFVPPLKIIEPLGLYETTENKVSISWDNVENAESYNISVVVFEKPNKLEGSNSRFVIEEGIKGTKHTLDFDKINSNLHGFMIDQEGSVNPQAYTGPFYPGATVPVIIEAFDKNKNKLTSSVPVNVKYENSSLIKVSDKNINNGDKLLLEGSIDKAVLEYEKDLLNNPNDTHDLLVLSKIYSIGTKIKHDTAGKETSEGRNPERAFELATRLYDITGESEYQRNVLRGISTHSDRNISWILEKYYEMDDKSLEHMDFGSIGNLNLIIGNFQAADEHFNKVFSALRDKKYYDMRPVLLKLYNKDYNSVLSYLNKIDLSLYKFDKEAFEKDILMIIGESKNTMEYKEFEEALRIVLRMENTMGTKEKFKVKYEDINSPVFKNILKQVGDYYYLLQ
jgi:hypothetical protein